MPVPAALPGHEAFGHARAAPCLGWGWGRPGGSPGVAAAPGGWLGPLRLRGPRWLQGALPWDGGSRAGSGLSAGAKPCEGPGGFSPSPSGAGGPALCCGPAPQHPGPPLPSVGAQAPGGFTHRSPHSSAQPLPCPGVPPVAPKAPGCHQSWGPSPSPATPPGSAPHGCPPPTPVSLGCPQRVPHGRGGDVGCSGRWGTSGHGAQRDTGARSGGHREPRGAVRGHGGRREPGHGRGLGGSRGGGPSAGVPLRGSRGGDAGRGSRGGSR